MLVSDIKVKEPTEESLTKKVRQYMDPKFMSVKDAARQLVEIIANKNNDKQGISGNKLTFIYLNLKKDKNTSKYFIAYLENQNIINIG